MPSGYYSIYDNDELYHFGVKGMKWGIRRYQNSDGTLTSDGKKRASERTQKRIDSLKRKISKTDSNPLMRYTINDNRRGQIEYLKRKKRYQNTREKATNDLRTAKANYKNNKTESQKKKIKELRVKRRKAAVNLYSNRMNNTLPTRMQEGSHKRFLAKGDKAFNAYLKSVGIGLATAIAIDQLKKRGPSIAVNVGSKVVAEVLKNQYNNPIYTVPDI